MPTFPACLPAASRSLAVLLSLQAPLVLGAQHDHLPADSSRGAWTAARIGVQAVASGTRLVHAIDGRTLTEGYVSQPAVMAHARAGWLAFTGTLNLEGLTLRRGELLGGVYGEGYVDRRHPHTLLHEAMAAVQGTVPGLGRAARVSLAAGKGFVPFGTDDPMMRPFERYPVNHHLAQVLERAVAIAALRVPRAAIEVAAFNGDEPTGPWSWPRARRFGDSWSTRVSALPLGRTSGAGWSATGLELSASVAGIRAPENPDGGGLDQRKWSAAARWASGAPLGNAAPGEGRYALVEWARTDWLRGGRRVRVTGYRNESMLAEGGVRRRGVELVARVEQTDRQEEERGVDPFRTVRPAIDVATLGVTRWRTLTLGAAVPRGIGRGAAAIRVAPFAEASVLAPRAVVRSAVFDPRSFYGATRLWALTAGVRLGAGMRHARMGRYGVVAATHPTTMGMP